MTKSINETLADASLSVNAKLVEIRFHIETAKKLLDLAKSEPDRDKSFAHQMKALEHIELLRELCGVEDET